MQSRDAGSPFGALLRRYRKAAGLTQEALAQKAVVSARNIQKLERGENRPLKDTARRLAEALDLGERDRALLLTAVIPVLRRHSAPVTPAADQPAPQPPGGAAISLPTGMLAVLVADVRGYTAFTHAHGDAAGARLASRFAALADEAIRVEGGRLVEVRGDEVLAVFTSTRAALRAGVGLLARCAEAASEDLPLRAGVGLDVGEPVAVGEGYRGEAINTAARLCAVAGPGEVLASEASVSLARRVEGLVYQDRGELALKGIMRPVRAWLVREGAGSVERAEAAAHRLPAPLLGAMPPGERRDHAGQPPLVGRAHELALLQAHLAGDGPPLLLLAGEPGIGKSRLLREAAAQAVQAGWRVLAGGCQRRGGQEPYAPLLEAIERHLQGQTDVELRAELAGCAWLVRLLPELAVAPIEPLPTWRVSPEQERRLLFRAVARLLANAAGPAGTLLVLDDLQWAGSDAIELLAALVRTPDLPLRVLGAYRDTEVAAHDPLALALADLAQAGLARQHTLGPLAPEEASRLLATLLEGVEGDQEALAAAVVQRAGGVPFFLVSCAQEVRRCGPAPGGETVPWDAAQGIRQRVATLPAAAQEVLGAAALIGRLVSPALLVAAAAQPESAVWAALDAAAHAHLLSDLGEGYQFAHDLIREVVEREVGAGRRLALHRRIAEALERQAASGGEAPVAALAYHYARSDAPDKAVLYLEQAGDQAEAQYAHAAAAAHYQQLVERLEAGGRAGEEAQAREKLGAVLRLEGRYAAALDVIEPAATYYRAQSDLESLGRVIAQVAWLHADCGTALKGIERIRPALVLLEDRGPSPALASLLTVLASLSGRPGRFAEGLAAAERAAAMASAIGDNALLVDAELERGGLLYVQGRTGEALQVYERLIPLAEATGRLRSLAWALNTMADILLRRGDFEASRRLLEGALEAAEHLGEPMTEAVLTMHRGYLRFCSGEWHLARADGEQALALGRRLGIYHGSAQPLIVLGFVSFGEGDWTAARASLEESVTLADSLSNWEALQIAHSVLAEMDLQEGRPAAAVERLRAALDRGTTRSHDAAFVLPKLAWAHLELGEIAQAEAVSVQALEFAQHVEDFLNLVEATRVRALVLMAQRHWGEAERALAEVLVETQRRRYPWGEARVLDALGLLHTRTAADALARERLGAAQVLFRRLGARKDVERLERALAGLGTAHVQH